MDEKLDNDQIKMLLTTSDNTGGIVHDPGDNIQYVEFNPNGPFSPGPFNPAINNYPFNDKDIRLQTIETEVKYLKEVMDVMVQNTKLLNDRLDQFIKYERRKIEDKAGSGDKRADEAIKSSSVQPIQRRGSRNNTEDTGGNKGSDKA